MSRPMKGMDVRQSFIDFFTEKDHQVRRSAPVVPFEDPTLLFTNAGMNQFKPIFTGDQEAPHPRVVNSQKCIRVSGKHNDLEEVGVDTFHHTFFEMLGNWSFGDYYKAEAIQWAWELLTDVWGLDKQRLWATVYEDDDEAFELWPKVTDISPDRVLRFGAKENFWEMGETGPCGPCSEIHYYIGDDLSGQKVSGINVSNAYWELWNLVFIQYNRNDDGSLEELPSKHIDTGAGLERLVTVLQGKESNYDTDLFMPLIRRVQDLTGSSYGKDSIPHRVIADHIRMLSFSIADGALPANEGRGYVLRRILRRAARFGRMLGQGEPFLYRLVDIVGEIMGSTYPEILDKRAHIENVIKTEEIAFIRTLDRGLIHFEKVLKNLSGKKIPGKEVFRLYDTYGFPLDLTQLMAREKGLSVDEEGFKKAMEYQKERAKASGKFKPKINGLKWNRISEGKDSKFLGYDTLTSPAKIRRWAIKDDLIMLVLDQTPFYAESGGQVGDTGHITGPGIDLTVLDCRKDGERIIHSCQGDIDENNLGETVECHVNGERRQSIRLNHTATHLLHAALKEVLGTHVHQAGSLVHPDYLRFDLTHFGKISPREIKEVENLVNHEILKNTSLNVHVTSFDAAQKEGAEALFGEKYGDEVRVVTVGSFSKELCAGTHVDRTGDIGSFKITEESSLASGVRRLVAVTGTGAVETFQEQSDTLSALQTMLNCPPDEIADRVEQILDQRRDLMKKLKQKPESGKKLDLAKWVKDGTTVGNSHVIVHTVETESLDHLKDIGDRLLVILQSGKSELRSGIGILGSHGKKKPLVVVVVTPDLVDQGIRADTLAKSIGPIMGGGGGGKSHLATAGGKNPADLEKALDEGMRTAEAALINLQTGSE